MNSEITGAIIIFLLSAIIAWPLGIHISKVFKDGKNFMGFMAPLEKLIFKISGVDYRREMDWKQNSIALLSVNVCFFLFAFALLTLQGFIPFLNPNNFENWEPTLAFNTAVSFATNTNLQHYSGESGASYFTQLGVFAWLQFVSAATGIAACALLFRGLANRTGKNLGNFYNLMVKSSTRILLPLAVVLSLILTLNGTTTNLKGLQTVTTLEGDEQLVAGGPTAPMVSIKQLGTNGGGFFGPNSTHPFENPNYLTNIAENIAIILIPMALVFAFGFYLNRKKLALIFFGLMSLLFISFTSISAYYEVEGNKAFAEMNLEETVNMEGKEVRFGPVASSLWGVSTTATSNGSVNSMHDSHMPLSGGIFMLDMFINAVYGGVGVGFINFFVFVVVAVFIAGQMIGRTPDLFGKKLEAKEIKIAALVVILHPLLILTGTAISANVAAGGDQAGWLNNPGFHGFSEMLYEFTSAAANNGSGFEGLGDNTPFWNIATGIVMLLARFIPIIGPLAIIGSLSAKTAVPVSSGSLKLESSSFAILLLSVILIVAALAFFPALALGPIAEFFTI